MGTIKVRVDLSKTYEQHRSVYSGTESYEMDSTNDDHIVRVDDNGCLSVSAVINHKSTVKIYAAGSWLAVTSEFQG